MAGKKKIEEKLNTEGMNLSDEISARLKKDAPSTSDRRERHYLPSNIALFDLALSTQLIVNEEGNRIPVIGRGLPSGSMTTLLGAFGSGKSTILCNFLASAQALGGEAILFDHEIQGVSDSLLTATGVNPRKLHKSSPIWGEETLTFVSNIIKDKMDSNVPIVIGIDSIAAMNFRNTEKKSYYETPQVAYKASMFARFFMDINAFLGASRNTYLIVTNHVGKELNMGFSKAPPQDTYPCKRQLDYNSNIIIKMSKIETDKDQDNDIVKFVTLQVDFKKNKFSNEVGRKFPLHFYVNPGGMSMGLDDPKSSMEFLISRGVFKPITAQSFSVFGQSMTRMKIRKEMYSNPDFYVAVRQLVVNTYLNERSLSLVDPNQEEGESEQ